VDQHVGRAQPGFKRLLQLGRQAVGGDQRQVGRCVTGQRQEQAIRLAADLDGVRLAQAVNRGHSPAYFILGAGLPLVRDRRVGLHHGGGRLDVGVNRRHLGQAGQA